LIFVKLLTITV